MKKEYNTPMAEKVQFDYTETVMASKGHKYQLYTDGYYACRETPTDKWVDGDMTASCTWD